MLLAIAAITGGLFLLIFGADRFVTGAAQTARGLGISPLIIGMTIVGMATSAPEVLVGSVAALQGKTNIAIGNAIGSNIANIGLVLGGTALFLPLEAASKTLRREYLVMLASILLALLFSLDCRLSRLDGLLLIIALIIITWWIIKLARSVPRKDPLANEFGQELKEVLPIWKSPARIRRIHHECHQKRG
jgi:cation:H+ antiporter